MDEQMTPTQALEATIALLEGVTLPRGMTAAEAIQILSPVGAAIGNLRAIIEAIRAAEEQEEKTDG